MSIYENAVAGLRFNGVRKKALLDEAAESALIAAALWDSVKDRLKANGSTLSGGEQQRLCIARALAVEPEVLLMDEPTSALDPIATKRIEELVGELKDRVTIVIVTHNMQQAMRVSDRCAFLLMGEDKAGELIEFGPTGPAVQRAEGPAHPRLRERPLRLSGRSGGAGLRRSPAPRCGGRTPAARRACRRGRSGSRRPAPSRCNAGIGGVGLELGPQPVDVGVERPGVGQIGVRPQQVDQLVARAHPPGRVEEGGQEVELLAGQVDRVPGRPPPRGARSRR